MAKEHLEYLQRVSTLVTEGVFNAQTQLSQRINSLLNQGMSNALIASQGVNPSSVPIISIMKHPNPLHAVCVTILWAFHIWFLRSVRR